MFWTAIMNADYYTGSDDNKSILAKKPLDKEMPVEKSFAHKQAVKLLLDNNVITANQLVEETGCSAEELEQYCFWDKGTLEMKENSKIIALKIRT